MAKGNIRSMRFSDQIIELIESQVGDTFTAKFEALVTKCCWELPMKEQELTEIQRQIENERKRLKRIRDQANAIESQFNNIKYNMQNMNTTINIALDRLRKTIEEK